MFANLSEKLQRVFKSMRGEGRLSAENMETALREIRVALLEADVNFRVVKQLIENIKEKAMGEEVLTALSPSQQVIKIVKEELVKILGSHESKLRFANEPPSTMLIVGLQGSGKTTSTGKLARQTFDRNQCEFFQEIREISHLFQGITDASMAHDEGWAFIQIGKYLERIFPKLGVENRTAAASFVLGTNHIA